MFRIYDVGPNPFLTQLSSFQIFKFRNMETWIYSQNGSFLIEKYVLCISGAYWVPRSIRSTDNRNFVLLNKLGPLLIVLG